MPCGYRARDLRPTTLDVPCMRPRTMRSPDAERRARPTVAFTPLRDTRIAFVQTVNESLPAGTTPRATACLVLDTASRLAAERSVSPDAPTIRTSGPSGVPHCTSRVAVALHAAAATRTLLVALDCLRPPGPGAGPPPFAPALVFVRRGRRHDVSDCDTTRCGRKRRLALVRCQRAFSSLTRRGWLRRLARWLGRRFGRGSTCCVGISGGSVPSAIPRPRGAPYGTTSSP